MDGRGRKGGPGWSVSLVIPAYNEEAGIRRAVREADRALARLAARYEILIVDDGSTDATADVARKAARRRPNVRVLRHARNHGYGAALRTGFQAARFDRVAFTDADCQFHLDDLGSLLSLTDHYPLAVGYRVNRRDSWRRRSLSWGYNVLVRWLLGTRVRDCDCALKVFRKEALLNLLPASRGFFVNTEILTRARQLGFAVAEVPVRHRPRLRGRSTVRLSDIPRTLAQLLAFWWSRVLFRNGAPAVPASVVAFAGRVRVGEDIPSPPAPLPQAARGVSAVNLPPPQADGGQALDQARRSPNRDRSLPPPWPPL
jgi:dolichol-phosphate mannosyltransferase